jgi:hypothetical protein
MTFSTLFVKKTELLLGGTAQWSSFPPQEQNIVGSKVVPKCNLSKNLELVYCNVGMYVHIHMYIPTYINANVRLGLGL